MKTIIAMKDAAGRTVEAIKNVRDLAAVIFTDGTAVVLSASGEFPYIEWWTPDEKILEAEVTYAVNLGLMTREEFDEVQARRRASSDEEREERERELYARLKEKYG